MPFVGAAGKFLDQMLMEAGLARKDIYITNIVKYRPPNNRDPLPEEKREFWPYLMRQLEIIQPKAVLTLGRHSGMAFIPDLVISRDHGVRVRFATMSRSLWSFRSITRRRRSTTAQCARCWWMIL